MVYKTGDKPEKGVYICKKCFKRIVIDENNDTLPVCPRCGHEEFREKKPLFGKK